MLCKCHPTGSGMAPPASAAAPHIWVPKSQPALQCPLGVAEGCPARDEVLSAGSALEFAV